MAVTAVAVEDCEEGGAVVAGDGVDGTRDVLSASVGWLRELTRQASCVKPAASGQLRQAMRRRVHAKGPSMGLAGKIR